MMVFMRSKCASNVDVKGLVWTPNGLVETPKADTKKIGNGGRTMYGAVAKETSLEVLALYR